MVPQQKHQSFRKPTPGKSAADKYPELLCDWDTDNNLGTLYDYTPSSHYNAHWKCSKCGYEWDQQIGKRTAGYGCIKCGMRESSKKHIKPLPGQSFADIFPILALDWNYTKNTLSPFDVKPHSNLKVYWKCHKCGAEWEGIINTRLRKKCPNCKNSEGVIRTTKAVRSQRDGKSMYEACPELIDEWDFNRNSGIDPYTVSIGSHKKVWWKCKECGNEWATVVKNRTLLGTGCPICSNKRISMKQSHPQKGCSLGELYPEIATEWDYEKNDGLSPFDVYHQTNKKIWWKCENGHSWRQTPNARVGQGCGCPKCARQHQAALQATPRDNQSFADLFPDIASEWAGNLNGDCTPYDFKPYSMARTWWRCTKCGYVWEMSITARTSQKQGCPKCALAYKTSFPEQAVLFFMRRDIDSDAIGQYRIPNPHGGEYSIDVYIPSINTAIEYDGKHWHKNKQVDQRKEDVILNAGIKLFRIIEDDNDFVDGNHIHFTCNDHNKSRKDNAKLSSVIVQLEGMMGYNGADIDVEKYAQDIMKQYRFARPENNIADNHPDLMRDWDYDKNSLDPHLISEKSSLRVHWKCHECGHEWETPVRNRTINGTGCRKCRMREHNQKLGKLKHERHLRELEEQKHKNNIS